MSQTAEDICNLTLAYLGKQSDDRVTSLSPPTNKVEKTFAPIFPVTLRQELRKGYWNCAKHTKSLTQLAEVLVNVAKPYQYDLPNDYIKDWRDKDSEWERRGNRVVSAYKNTLVFPYIREITPDLIDPLLAEVVARSMQMKLSRPYTKSNPEFQSAFDMYRLAMSDATLANAMENGPVDIDFRAEEGNWLTERY